MGLTMYITKETHHFNRDQFDPTFSTRDGFTDIQYHRVMKVKEIIGWWSGFTPIEEWFSQNVKYPTFERSGKKKLPKGYLDKKFEINQDDIKKLLNTCKKIKSNNNLSKELLPYPDWDENGNTYDKDYYHRINNLTRFLQSLVKEMNTDTQTQLYYYKSMY
jgi:hypothetical protein